MDFWKFYISIILIKYATASNETELVSSNQTESDEQIRLKMINDVIKDYETILLSSNNKEYSDYSEEVGQTSDTTAAPDTNNSDKLLMIEDQIKKLKEELEVLKKGQSLSQDDLAKITSLETIINQLNLSLDDLKKELETSDKKNRDRISGLMKELEKSMMNCIMQGISCRQLTMIEPLLITGNDDFLYELILKYFNIPNFNFDTILLLLESIKNNGLRGRLLAMLALFFKNFPMQYERIPGEFKVRFSDSFENYFKDPNSPYLNQTTTLYCNLLEQTPSSNIESLAAAFINDNSWQTVTEFNQRVISLCGSGSVKILIFVYDAVMNKIFDKLGVLSILQRITQNLSGSTESIILQVAVCKKLRLTGKLNTNAAITIARYVKKTMDQHSNSPLLTILQQNCGDSLPPLVQSLVFSPAVYLRSARYNEYLFAAQEVDSAHNTERRSVYTWMPSDMSDPLRFQWKASFQSDDGITLINVKFNETLSTCSDCTYDSKRRYVYTTQKESRSQQNTWNLLLDGNGIHLKNVQYNEYMHPDFYEKKDMQRRHVFTSTTKEKTDDSAWEVLNAEF